MRNRKFHTRQFQDDYPNPGVPADDAWAAMKNMLDAGTPQPPESAGKKVLSRDRGLFWYIAFLAVIVPGLLWLLQDRYNSSKVENNKLQVVHSNNAERRKNNTLARSSDNVAGNGNSAYNNGAINKANAEAVPGGANHRVDAHGNSLSHEEETTATVGINGQNVAGKNNITDRGRREYKLASHKSKNGRNLFTEANGHGGFYIPGRTNRNSSTIHSGTITPKTVRGNNIVDKDEYASIAHETVNTRYNDHLRSIVDDGSLNVGDVASSLTEFLHSRDQVELDSSFLKKLNRSITGMSSPAEGKINSPGKLKTSNRTPGFNYGFQWQVPIPVQETRNYGMSTNGNVDAFNLLLPQLWISKGISSKSKVLVTVNFKQQYFINNKQLARDVLFMAPRDTGVSKTNLSKIGGFGGIITWSYEISRHWAASLGINYTLNRSALLDKQSTNFYTGNIISDSLYTIDTHSPDWRYINRSMLATHLEVYYIFKKFNLGASATLPLNGIPVYNKNIRPLNAQLFIRWNMKR